MENAGSDGGGGGGSQVVHVTTAHLVATALPLLFVAAVGHHFDLGIENGLMVGIARSFVQLMILGMILQPIFVLGMDMSWVVGLCELLLLFLFIMWRSELSCSVDDTIYTSPLV